MESARSSWRCVMPKSESGRSGVGKLSSNTKGSSPRIQYMNIVPSWKGKSFSSHVSNFLRNAISSLLERAMLMQSCCWSIIISLPSLLDQASWESVVWAWRKWQFDIFFYMQNASSWEQWNYLKLINGETFLLSIKGHEMSFLLRGQSGNKWQYNSWISDTTHVI